MNQMDMSTEKKYRLINYNFKLLIFVIAAMIMGTITIYSVRPDYLTKQLIGVGACIIGLVIVSFIDYNFICKYYMLLYSLNIIFLVLVLGIGSGGGDDGVHRWFYISDSFTVQPSEFSKIILIICTAVFIEKNYENLNTPKVLAKLAVFLAVPVGLIVAEPDLSTSICIMVYWKRYYYCNFVPDSVTMYTGCQACKR